MVPQHSELMEPVRSKMKPPAQRVRQRLRFVMIIQASQVAPARGATEFNEPRAEHNSKNQPAEQPDHELRRRPARERPPVQQRAEENRQKTRLQELNLPAVTVPILPDMDE